MNCSSPIKAVATIYARVSTSDCRQTTADQVPDLQRLAAARGFEAIVYEEQESAAKHRPVLEQILADARAGRVQAVIVWALDRLHRSMMGAVNTVLELDRLGVQVISLKESWLDTASPVRSLLVAIFGWWRSRRAHPARRADQGRARTCSGSREASRAPPGLADLVGGGS